MAVNTDPDVVLDSSPGLGNTVVPGDSEGFSDQRRLFSYTVGFLGIALHTVGCFLMHLLAIETCQQANLV